VIYDHRGARLERVKQFGFIQGPAEFRTVPRPAGALVELPDAIATERIELEPDEDEE
jgi:hypothetical protein